MKQEYKQMFMEQADAAARASKAVRMKVGCVLVKDGENLSSGMNGMPPKWPTEVCEDKVYAKDELWYLYDGFHSIKKETWDWIKETYPYVEECEKHKYTNYKLVTKPECRHAEVAALEKMWKSHNTTEGAHCFVTLSPCKNCAIKLHTAGITKVYYKEEYRSDEGIKYLIDNNVEVEKL